MQRRVKEAGEVIEALLVSDQNQEAWKRIASWYMQASRGHSPPLRENLERIETEGTDIYRCRPTEGLWVPILTKPEEVEDRIPEKSEMAQEMGGLKRGRCSGLSGMGLEDLHG